MLSSPGAVEIPTGPVPDQGVIDPDRWYSPHSGGVVSAARGPPNSSISSSSKGTCGVPERGRRLQVAFVERHFAGELDEHAQRWVPRRQGRPLRASRTGSAAFAGGGGRREIQGALEFVRKQRRPDAHQPRALTLSGHDCRADVNSSTCVCGFTPSNPACCSVHACRPFAAEGLISTPSGRVTVVSLTSDSGGPSKKLPGTGPAGAPSRRS